MAGSSILKPDFSEVHDLNVITGRRSMSKFQEHRAFFGGLGSLSIEECDADERSILPALKGSGFIHDWNDGAQMQLTEKAASLVTPVQNLTDPSPPLSMIDKEKPLTQRSSLGLMAELEKRSWERLVVKNVKAMPAINLPKPLDDQKKFYFSPKTKEVCKTYLQVLFRVHDIDFVRLLVKAKVEQIPHGFSTPFYSGILTEGLDNVVLQGWLTFFKCGSDK